MDPLQEVEFTRALVVCAHPDDAEFGAGGTMARWAAEGKEVVLCVVSNGAMGSNNPDVARDDLIATREREQRAAAAVVGAAGGGVLGDEGGRLQGPPQPRPGLIPPIPPPPPPPPGGPPPPTLFLPPRHPDPP